MRCDHHRLRAAARGSRDAHTGRVGPRLGAEVVEDADALPGLHDDSQVGTVVLQLESQRRFAPGPHVVTENRGTHLGQHGAAELLVGAVTSPLVGNRGVGFVVEMAVRREHDGDASPEPCGHVERSRYPDAGQDFQRDVLDGVAVVPAQVAPNRREVALFQAVEPQRGEHVCADAGLAGFESLACGVEFEQAFQVLFTFGVGFAEILPFLDLVDTGGFGRPAHVERSQDVVERGFCIVVEAPRGRFDDASPDVLLLVEQFDAILCFDLLEYLFQWPVVDVRVEPLCVEAHGGKEEQRYG